MHTLALLAALAAASVVSCTHGNQPSPPSTATSTDVFDAIKARDAARLGALLDAQPLLAGARRADGTSALLVALFMINPDQESFARADDNAMLRALAARHPPLDVFDAAAVGDVARLDALVDADPALVKTTHPVLGTTPLHVAAFAGRADAVEHLIARGAEVNAAAKNKFHNTPLVVACLTKQRAVAERLIAKGADLEAPEEGGYRALHIAASADDVPMIALLLDHGAKIDARADDGSTPLDLANRKGHAAARAALAARAK